MRLFGEFSAVFGYAAEKGEETSLRKFGDAGPTRG